MLQLELFAKSENQLLKEMDDLKKSTDKVRRGLFAKQSELAKICFDVQNRLEILEKNICASSDGRFLG